MSSMGKIRKRKRVRQKMIVPQIPGQLLARMSKPIKMVTMARGRGMAMGIRMGTISLSVRLVRKDTMGIA